MRLLILHQAWVFGGAERTTANLLGHLDRDLVRQVTLAAPEALRALLPDRFDHFIDTGPLIRHGWLESPRALLADVRATTGLLDEARPDLVLGMMHYSAALAALAARRARTRPKVVASFRGPVYEHIRRYEHGLRRRAFLFAAIGATARLSDRLIVPSHGTAQEARRRFLAPARRTIVIPNGIDTDLVESEARAPAPGMEALPEGMPRLCGVARLSSEKDVGLLLEAFRRVQAQHPATLVIVGDGPERPSLEARVADWGLRDRVAFVGHRENVYPYLRRADLYVHTCQFEGFGYTMLEALACGTPVVATDCPYGPREVLDQGRCGILVPPGDPGALAAAISGLLEDAARRRTLSELGLARARALSVQQMAHRYGQLFADLAAAP